jgi:hypothetical protein
MRARFLLADAAVEEDAHAPRWQRIVLDNASALRVTGGRRRVLGLWLVELHLPGGWVVDSFEDRLDILFLPLSHLHKLVMNRLRVLHKLHLL